MGDIADFTHQPKPKGSGPIMHDLVCADLQKRKEFGVQKYGEGLKAHNGRDALQDVYEELLDAAVYIKQCMQENLPARGQPMPQTLDAYRKLANQDLELIEEQKQEIAALKRKLNKARQK